MIKIKYNIGSKPHTKEFSSYEILGIWIIKMHGLIEIMDFDTSSHNIKPIGIELRNINLTGLTLVDELTKAEEEEKEFIQALLGYLYDKHEISRNHLLEELCDTIQVKLSTMKTIDIDIEEIVAYWNTKHLEKLKNRPRKEN